jgi:hypothetical protein
MTRIMLVYKTLGQVLNSPRSFGLGGRAPQGLVDALTASRHWLREEMLEDNEQSYKDWLSSELSQDADRAVKEAVVPDRRH